MTINFNSIWDNCLTKYREGDFIHKTVYIDILLCVNLIINYFILLAVSKFTKITPRQYRLILGGGFGALCSLIILLPEINGFINVLIKLIIAAIIVLIAFGRQSRKVFLKNMGVFFLISFCFCGIMIAFWFVFTPKGMVVNNSVVYFNISPVIMIVSSVVCYFILRLVSKLSGRETPGIEICKIRIIGNSTYAEIYGKVDTGNSLTEPFSNAPVIVADRKSVKKVIPKEIEELLTYKNKAINTSSNKDLPKSIRFIPFNSVGGDGILPAFIPEEIYINNALYKGNVYIALCGDNRLTGECKAMVNPQITGS